MYKSPLYQRQLFGRQICAILDSQNILFHKNVCQVWPILTEPSKKTISFLIEGRMQIDHMQMTMMYSVMVDIASLLLYIIPKKWKTFDRRFVIE